MKPALLCLDTLVAVEVGLSGSHVQQAHIHARFSILLHSTLPMQIKQVELSSPANTTTWWEKD